MRMKNGFVFELEISMPIVRYGLGTIMLRDFKKRDSDIHRRKIHEIGDNQL